MSHQHRGFTKDTSSAAQSKRAKAGSRVSPWRKGPMCDTGRAKASFIHYCMRGKSKPA